MQPTKRKFESNAEIEVKSKSKAEIELNAYKKENPKPELQKENPEAE